MKTQPPKHPLAENPELQVVSQVMLAEYEALCRLEQLRQARRCEIIELLESGATVEKGPLVARLSQQKRVVCSWAALDEFLGSDEVEYLRSQIKPHPVKRLDVALRSNKGGKG